MAIFCPPKIPKVFSPRILIREDKDVDLCLGQCSADIWKRNYTQCYKDSNTTWNERPTFLWSSLISQGVSSPFFPQLYHGASVSYPFCCYAYNVNLRELSKQPSTLSHSCTDNILPVCFDKPAVLSHSDFTKENSPLFTLDVGTVTKSAENGDLQNFIHPHPKSEISESFTSETTQKLPTRRRIKRPKNFQCPYCDVCCSNQGQLKGHVRIHTGERPYRCTEKGCNKAFIRNEELTRHRRIHTGERPHKCDLCGKAFSRKDHLNKHVKVHTYESDFVNI